MGFIAKNFSFNRIPCSEYGLRIYDIDGNTNNASPFANTGKILTSVVPSTGRNFLYGRSFDNPLEFKLVFGVDPKKIRMDDYLDRYEMDAIANWLTGYNKYKWLEIEQPDMETIRYHCIITHLEPIQVDWLPWAFTATVVCDSPYAYRYPVKFHYVCNGTTEIKLISRSTINPLYYPKLDITLNGSNNISLLNQSVEKEFRFDNLPTDYFLTASIDNAIGKIVSSDPSYSNLYQYCNFEWLPLKKGMNKILVTGNCVLDFTCEFPVNFGG